MRARILPMLAMLLLLTACRPPPEATPVPAPASPPQPAPPAASPGVVESTAAVPRLSAPTVGGGLFDLAAHRGRWVVVNFWATWCAPCLKEMPELSALHAMREQVEVVGLAYEDIAPEDMRTFLQAHPVAYPIVIVDPMDPPQDFATPRGLPITYLIAPDGKVARQFLGPVTAHDLENAIRASGGQVR
ncbi:MAG: TlpA family protein disulfide reductase [Xanthomonadaceae bacterium]|nr:TlpA family protein disulfide reductase [Xanthomonadaceae bacterium]